MTVWDCMPRKSGEARHWRLPSRNLRQLCYSSNSQAVVPVINESRDNFSMLRERWYKLSSMLIFKEMDIGIQMAKFLQQRSLVICPMVWPGWHSSSDIFLQSTTRHCRR